MALVDEQQVHASLAEVVDPLTQAPLLSHTTLSGVTPLTLEDGPATRVHLTFSYPLAGALAYWQRTLREALAPVVAPVVATPAPAPAPAVAPKMEEESDEDDDYDGIDDWRGGGMTSAPRTFAEPAAQPLLGPRMPLLAF